MFYALESKRCWPLIKRSLVNDLLLLCSVNFLTWIHIFVINFLLLFLSLLLLFIIKAMLFFNHTMGRSLSFSPTEQLTLLLRLYSCSHHCTKVEQGPLYIHKEKTKGVSTMVRNEDSNTVFSIFTCLFRGSCVQCGRYMILGTASVAVWICFYLPPARSLTFYCLCFNIQLTTLSWQTVDTGGQPQPSVLFSNIHASATCSKEFSFLYPFYSHLVKWVTTLKILLCILYCWS